MHEHIIAALSRASGGCHSDGDGDCEWDECPMLKPDAPAACPLFPWDADEE